MNFNVEHFVQSANGFVGRALLPVRTSRFTEMDGQECQECPSYERIRVFRLHGVPDSMVTGAGRRNRVIKCQTARHD